jgi:hypothetical protein
MSEKERSDETNVTEQPTPPKRDWGARGPNGEPPNLRLAHTIVGSQERAIHGECYPALAEIRTSGVRYDLPTLEGGEPDKELQAAGFFHAYAHRIVRVSPHYKFIESKGA